MKCVCAHVKKHGFISSFIILFLVIDRRKGGGGGRWGTPDAETCIAKGSGHLISLTGIK